MIGVCTKYRHTDATHAALSVARYLDDKGIKSALTYYDWRAGNVDPAFDNRVRKAHGIRPPNGVKQTVWTSPVDPLLIHIAKEYRVRNTIFTSWDQLEPRDEDTLDEYRHVLVPTVSQAVHLRDRCKLKNIAVLPFSCGYPITKKDNVIQRGKVKLFMSLYGNQLRRVQESAILILAAVVADYPKVSVTIASSAALSHQSLRLLRQHQKVHESRWKVVIGAPWREHARFMCESDLTVWPPLYDGMGLIGVTSLHMGTPVLSWDIAPINEHLSSGRNAILVKCDTEYDQLGVPRAIPNYPEFERSLRWLIDNPKAMTELRSRTHERLTEWDTEFKKGLDTVIPE